ncbi:RND transporter [Cryobacterium sp. TMT1-21]|uniref:MMPL family transporter n=1 Tax=unclassified Cryobacterium TaxID=2649013 RepID=UPI00106A7C24|nr:MULTISPECIES: MMPL family transporter [unclassified Cryobacterium]TFD18118.1 RND transporter [Cryobacterium sp. TMT1-21]TFD40086.1 RND transporter [Cryobacterium sp. TMT2-10]
MPVQQKCWAGFFVPGTASGAVIDALEKQLPEFAGASGTVVFETTDGSALSSEQREQISALVAGGGDLPDVADVIDPFEAEQQRADRVQQIADGRSQLGAGRAQLDAGQAQLDAARAQLAAAQTQLDQALKQPNLPAEQLSALETQQAQLGAGVPQLDDQQATLDASRAELQLQTEKIERGAVLLDLSEGIRVVSADGAAALVNVAFSEPRLKLEETSKQAVIDYFDSEPIDGTRVSFSSDIAQSVPQLIGVGEIVGVEFAGIILLVMLGSVVAAALPLVTALVGVAIASLGALAFSGVVPMASVTPFLGVMLGLAVGIDYSLFVINRHRKQLLQGAEPRESIGLANGTAGNAVVFAGTTVIVALLALNVTGVPFLGLMGTVGAVAVAVAVIIAISLTPAILGLLGERVLGRRARARIGEEHHEDIRAKPMRTWRAVVTVLATCAVLLIVAIPSLSMRVGLPDGSAEPVDSASYRAFMATEESFGAGATGPLLVTATLPEGLDDARELEAQVTVARTLAEQNDVVGVAPIVVSKDKRLAAFQVVPAAGPNSESTEQLVRDIRSMPPVDGDITLGVAGQAAINIDISENLADVLPTYLAVVVGLSLLIMILVFRSILVPVIATGGFILSLFATYGATVAVFQWGWFSDVLGVHTGPILSFLPVILVGVLFGLAMDYQLFLAPGMREAYVHGASARLAVARGFRAGRSVVTAAGLIMDSVFGGFVFSESTMIRSIGFGLELGVLIDAFLVRMLLMPALMHLLGRSAWWLPRWLDRIMPNVDVEGAALERRHHG